MSVVDRALQDRATPTREPPTPAVQDALAAILVASVFVDGALNIDESARVERILSTSRLFSTADVGSIERAIARLNDRGADAVLTASARALPPELRPAAFALAVELVLCDSRVEPRETAYIDRLQAALGVEEETAVRIVEALVLTNRV